MQYSTVPFTLVDSNEPCVIDVGALYAAVSTLTDRRKARGRRYPLALILTVAVLAKLAGYSRVEAIADWAKLRCQELQLLFATPRAQMPHHTTWSRILGMAVDVEELEQVVCALLRPATDGEEPERCSITVALDGKTIRGTIPRGQTRGVHLLAAYAPRQGVVLFQVAVDTKENEIVAAPVVLRQLALQGCLITGDAMFTQRALSVQIVEAGGDYLWMVKDNQPTLRQEIERLFEPACVSAGWSAPPVDFTTARIVESGHGRVEERILTTSSMLAGYSGWPSLAQVFKLEYWSKDTVTGKETTVMRYGVTSAPVTVLDAKALLEATRTHWGIETGLHSRRDGSLAEDSMRTRTGQAPHVLATLNNITLSFLGRQGITNVAEAQRAIAYHLDRFLHQTVANKRVETGA
ncbi:MAG: ISAs1 family transposase [Chloroflexia bacterium]|nr:ISAs1 family transposase [Chloroflexia bacterium]